MISKYESQIENIEREIAKLERKLAKVEAKRDAIVREIGDFHTFFHQNGGKLITIEAIDNELMRIAALEVKYKFDKKVSKFISAKRSRLIEQRKWILMSDEEREIEVNLQVETVRKFFERLEKIEGNF